MVGSAGTRQPAESRSHTGLPPRVPRARRRAGCTCGHALAPPTASRPCAYAGGGAVVKDVGVRPPNDGQAAADDARAHDRQKTLPQRRCMHVVRVDPQRLVGKSKKSVGGKSKKRLEGHRGWTCRF